MAEAEALEGSALADTLASLRAAQSAVRERLQVALDPTRELIHLLKAFALL